MYCATTVPGPDYYFTPDNGPRNPQSVLTKSRVKGNYSPITLKQSTLLTYYHCSTDNSMAWLVTFNSFKGTGNDALFTKNSLLICTLRGLNNQSVGFFHVSYPSKQQVSGSSRGGCISSGCVQ